MHLPNRTRRAIAGLLACTACAAGLVSCTASPGSGDQAGTADAPDPGTPLQRPDDRVPTTTGLPVTTTSAVGPAPEPTTVPDPTTVPPDESGTTTTLPADPTIPPPEPDNLRTSASGSPIQLIWGYKPPTDGTPLSTLSSHYSSFVLTRDDEPYRDQLVALGAPAPLMYIRFDAVLRPQVGRPPLKNNVADSPGDVDTLLSAHPGWFLRDGSGNPIIDHDMGGYDAYIMDPGNSGWREHWIAQVKARYNAEGWHGGIFLDNVELSLKKRIRFGATPAAYGTDDAYFTAVSGMLKTLYFNWTKWANLPVIPNTIEATFGDLAKPATVGEWTSGWLEEGFATSWRSDTWRTQADWEWQLAKIDQAVVAGDRTLLFAQGPRDDSDRQRFALASYLLVSSAGRTFFRYVDYTAGYKADWWYSNYTSALGAPTSGRYRVGATTWRRDFAHGSVTVDPTAHTASITVS